MANSENFKVKNGLDVGAEANITNDLNLGGNLYLNGGSVIFEGATEDDFELTLTVADPTADRTIILPDGDGTFVLAASDTTTTTQGNLNLDHTISATGTISTTGTAQGLLSSDSPTFAGLTIDGTSFGLINNATGSLTIQSNNLVLAGAGGATTYANFVEGGAAFLRYNDVNRFETTATGAAVTGNLVTDGLTLNGNTIVLEGATADAFNTQLNVVDPTQVNVINVPDNSGTFAIAANGTTTTTQGDLNTTVSISATGVVTVSGDAHGLATTDSPTFQGLSIEGATLPGAGGTVLYVDATCVSGENEITYVNSSTGDNVFKSISESYRLRSTTGVYSTVAKMLVTPTNSAAFTGNIEWLTESGAGLFTRLKIENDGKVVVGTTTSDSKFTVQGGNNDGITVLAANEPHLYLNTDDLNYQAVLFNSYGNVGLRIFNNDATYLNQAGLTQMVFYYNSGYPDANNAYTKFDVNHSEILRLTTSTAKINGSIILDSDSNISRDSAGALVTVESISTTQITMNGDANNNPTSFPYTLRGVYSRTSANITSSANLNGKDIYQADADQTSAGWIVGEPVEFVAANTNKTVLRAEAPTADRVITFPDASGTVVFTSGSDVLTVNAASGTTTLQTGDTLTITGGTYLTSSVSGNTVTIDHDSTTRSDTTSTESPAVGGTVDVVSSVTTNATGHITAIDVKTVTLPSDADTLDGIDSTSFLRSDVDDTVGGKLTFNDRATFIDGVTAKWGTDGDLEIVHDLGDAYITNLTGNLEINSVSGTILKHNGFTRLTTDSAGSSITGDLTVDTDTLYVDSTNNRVGVGTTNPVTDLWVESDSNTRIGIQSTQTTGDTQQTAGIYIRNRETSPSVSESVADIFLTGVNTTTFGGAKRFILRGQTGVETAIYSNNVEAVTIDTSQNVSMVSDLTVNTDALYVDSTNKRVGIGTTATNQLLRVVGSVNNFATRIENNSTSGGGLQVITNVSNSLARLFTLEGGGATRFDIKTDGLVTLYNNLLPDSTANNRNIGSATQVFNTVYATTFEGTATNAQYADLAEKYLADDIYGPGTVIAVGGDAEVTAAHDDIAHSVLGVVSDAPAFLMNKDLEHGTVIALKGRVPVKCVGTVRKGDRLAPSHFAGYATADNSRSAWSFAIALEDGADGLVEAVIL